MYQSLEAELHDHFWNSEEDNTSELPLLQTFLKEHPGKTLEIGCGSGRLLLPLIAEGFDVEGMEFSQDMIQLLETSAKEQLLTPKVHHADALEIFDFEHKFHSFLIPAFTIQLFSRGQAHDLLKRLHDSAEKSASLYLTTFIPWAEITGELEEDEWHLDKEITLPNHSAARCETLHTIDRLNQTLHRRHRYSLTSSNGMDTRTHKSEQVIRYYGLPELTLLLEKSGWHLENVITDLDPGMLHPNAHLLTITASAEPS
ncbi:hypothetical protein Rhal01_03049 [Rubritalea halochordaticola]|uniref:Methyltransferase domain-containing protein n=1 Tax=Rubritalea halochordaticola TaxID=714537 RepID=A0ABP9V2G8_9BACT